MRSLLAKLLRGRVLKTYQLEVLAEERHLGEIRDFITEIANDTGFSQQDVNNIKLALDEACSNVVRHAYRDQAPGPLRLEVTRRPREIEIRLHDRGKSFNWHGSRTPDLNRYVEIGKKGGLGVWFIRKLMDEARYTADKTGNHLCLVKRLKSSSPGLSALVPVTQAGMLSGESSLQHHKNKQVSVRIKYMLPVTGLVALLVLSIFAYMFSNQSKIMRAEILKSTVETAYALAKDSVDYLLEQHDLHLTNMVNNIMKSNDKIAYAFIRDQNNLIMAHSITRNLLRKYKHPAGLVDPQNQVPLIQTYMNRAGQTIHDVAYPIYMGGVRLGIVHVGILEQSIQKAIQAGRRNAVLIFLLVLLVSTVGAYYLMTLFIAPVRQLTHGMLAISQGQLNHRIGIRSNDEFGQIAMVFNDMTRRFQEAQKNLLEQERIQQEMQVAQEIQHTLLPREIPQIEGYEVYSLYRSAKEVGGDYYDFVWVAENVLGIAVADVSGKGIPGSLVMTMIRTALRLEARGNRNSTKVMERVNSFVTRDMRKGMFVTMFYIVLDARKRSINFSSAGHNPMILYRASTDKFYYLKPRGFPLGIDLPNPELFGKTLTQEHVDLTKGDLLLIYTDGITEAMNPRREQYGETRLVEFIRRNHELSSKEFINRLNEDIAAFTENYPQNDDITAVAIKEKMMADDLQIALRRRLFSMIEEEGVSVAKACRVLNFAPSTYYRLKRLKDSMGEKGLYQNLPETKERHIEQASLQEREWIRKAALEHPEDSPRKLLAWLKSETYGSVEISEGVLKKELKRMRLLTAAERQQFLKKT